MEYEGLDRPYRFIVTGQYLAVHYDGSNFEFRRDYHCRGTVFYQSDDENKIIYNRTYIGHLTDHPEYTDDVFYITQGSQYLTQDGQWTDRAADAVPVQIDPEVDWGDGDPPVLPPIPNPIIDERNPMSADGIDLYHPEKWFTLYTITGDCVWYGEAAEFNSKLCFLGNPYSIGIGFRLVKHEGKTRILSNGGEYLTVLVEAESARYLDGECKEHTRLSRCSRCMKWYTVGFSSEPQECFSLIPRGLPTMFSLYDGLCYYRFNALKGSYGELERVEDINDASLFQFVG